jgi:hypothetical protein
MKNNQQKNNNYILGFEEEELFNELINESMSPNQSLYDFFFNYY